MYLRGLAMTWQTTEYLPHRAPSWPDPCFRRTCRFALENMLPWRGGPIRYPGRLPSHAKHAEWALSR